MQTEILFVDIPNGKIYVKKWIPKNLKVDIPVILLHDSLGSTDLWKTFPEKLAHHLARTVISYDRLGFGKSSLRSEPPNKNFIQEEAEIYFPQIKKSLGIEKYILFGHSVGGPMGVAIAAYDPDCIALITEAAQAFVEDRTIKGLLHAKKHFEHPNQIDKLKKWHGEKAEWILRAWLDVWLSPDYANWSLEPYIGKINSPIFAIHGDKDEYGSIEFPIFISKKLGKNSKMLFLENCGHIPHKERTNEVLNEVSSFLNSLYIP